MATAKKTTAPRKDPRGSDTAKKPDATPAATTSHPNPHTDEPAPRRKVDTATVGKDPMVTVRIPRDYRLQVVGEMGHTHIMHHYKAGIDEMPLSHAEHEYSKANGVEIVTD